MEINLDIVEEFQKLFGEQPTFERAREFMFAYISQVQAPFPPIAARTFEVAKRFRMNMATAEECQNVSNDTWKYISEHKAWGDDSTPEYCIMRALTVLVTERLGPGENEHISEVVDWFLYDVDKFEDHSQTADALLRKYFLAPPSN